MAKKSFTFSDMQSGQSLVLILLILVIGAVIAFAIAARTVQDIRRVGLERLSSQAGTQVESMLDVVTTRQVWDSIVEDCHFIEDAGALCIDSFRPETNICVLGESELTDLLGDIECDAGGAQVQIRLEDNVEGMELSQDEVYEVSLNEATAGIFTLSWTGSDHMLVKVYSQVGGEVELESAVALVKPGAAEGWGTSDIGNNPIPYSADARFARIRPINGNAVVTLSDIPPQEYAVKASCYISSVYREFVRRVSCYNSVPACFDYVLYDGTSAVDEFGS